MTSLSVKKFTDYRAFLMAYVDEARTANARWSYGAWARKLGLSDTSSITKILQGSRDPGESIIARLCAYFSFSPEDERYFRSLVKLRKLENDPELSSLLLERMTKEFPDSKIEKLDGEATALFTRWYFGPLHQILRTQGVPSHPKEIAKRFLFKVTPRQISDGLEAMIRLGFVRKDAGGALRVVDDKLESSADVPNRSIRDYHRTMLKIAQSALNDVEVESREFTGTSFVMKCSNVPKAKTLIREFRDRFIQLLEEEPGDNVYQLHIQFFPLTR